MLKHKKRKQRVAEASPNHRTKQRVIMKNKATSTVTAARANTSIRAPESGTA